MSGHSSGKTEEPTNHTGEKYDKRDIGPHYSPACLVRLFCLKFTGFAVNA